MTPRLRSDVPNNQSAIGNVRFMLTSIISRNDSKALFHRHAGGRDSGGNVRRRWPWAWLYPNQGGLVRDWIRPGEAFLDEFDFRRCHLFVHFPLHFAA